jgi:hypothetical protein
MPQGAIVAKPQVPGSFVAAAPCIDTTRGRAKIAKDPEMSEPLIVVIPHSLGKVEALRRIKAGVERGRTEFARLMSVEDETWVDDRLTFRVSALGQRAAGIIDVYETSVRLEVTLPWLLARFAHAVQRVVGHKGQLMLEKK